MNIENHPCFNPGACKSFGRVHLPVAPRCNVQCNFCNRKFDCVNETRPGVTSSLLKPFQALRYMDEVMAKKKNISVMGIAGPGDPFANPDETLTTLRLVREKYPELLLCVATNGLNLPPWLDDVARLDVSHVSITVNAVGLLDEEPDIQLMNRLKDCASLDAKATDTRPYVAVATREGVLVNEHMGEARRLLIYELKHGEATLVDKRMPPKPGLPLNRWLEVAELIRDCRALLVSGIGTRPREVLTETGIEILEVGGLIDEAVSSVFTGKNLNHMIKREPAACGTDCSGGGMGC